MRPATFPLALLALLGTVSPGWGQEATLDLYGRTVTAVRFQVEGQPEDSPELLALVDVRAGEPLTREAVRSSQERLVAVGRYEGVSVIGTPVANGVEVTFDLVPLHVVNQLSVVGDTGIGAGALRSRLLQQYGGVPTGQRTEDIELAAAQILSDEGYLDPVVSSTIERSHDQEGATLVLEVAAGDLTRIASTVVEGPSPFRDQDVIRRTATSPGQPLRRRQIETAISALEDDLRSHGSYEAEVSLQVDRATEGARLRLIVETGPIVELRVEPSGVLPGDVDALIPIRRQRSADVDLLEDSALNIERLLKRDGYAAARVTFTRTPSEDNTRLLVTFSIDRGPRYFVDRIEVPDQLVLPADTIRTLIGIDEGDVFDEASFVQGLSLVVDEYRRRGYYQVEASPDRESLGPRERPAETWVVLHPNITEGPRGEIGAVVFEFAGDHAVPEDALREVIRSAVGQPYVEAAAAADRAALLGFYLDRGFVNAAVDVQPVFEDEGRRVSLAVRVNEGPQVRISEITVVGNERVSEQLVREELGLSVGDPLSEAALVRAQQRLYQMGVFRRVSVAPADRLGGATDARLIVSVVEGPSTTLGFGGGLEGQRISYSVNGVTEDQLEVAPRGFFEIGRQNIGGRNRSLNFFSRLSLRSSSDPEDQDQNGFTEYRTSLTYRERRPFRTNSDILFSVASEQARRTSFNFARRVANAEMLVRATPRLAVSGRYALEFTKLFDVEEGVPPDIDRLFPQIRLSSVSSGVSWDRRDSPLSPTRGTLLTADLQLAARSLASEVGFVKAFFQASAFRPFDDAGQTVLAVRGEVGAARGFERVVIVRDENDQPVTGPDGEPLVETVRDLPISQRFFAGGSTTVRGFQLDRLGVPDVFRESAPIGGNGLLVFNAELRRVVGRLFGRNFGVVGFLDGGNVFAHASQLDLSRVRGAAGFGARWDSPLGPIRLDFGFKLSREMIGTVRERGWEYHLSIGEAF